MVFRRGRLSVCTAAVAALVSAGGAAAADVTVTEIDGADMAIDLNEGGTVVVGSSSTRLWSEATGIEDLGIPGEVGFVNDSGQVATRVGSRSRTYRATRWSPGGATEDLGLGLPFDMNDAGLIVGGRFDADSLNPTVWTATGPVELSPDGGGANGVNDAGVVVGDLLGRAFSWTESGGLVDLGTYGGSDAYPDDVSDSGLVAGAVTTPSGVRAFVAPLGGAPTVLGTLGGNMSRASAVNDAGQVVGTSSTADGSLHGFSWTPGTGMVDLGTLGGSSSEARDVNDAGMIVGWAQRDGGSQAAVVWRVAGGSADADGDGIADAIDTGSGTFADAGTTSGTLGTIPAGYTVTVTDAADPDGVRIQVAGLGTAKVPVTLVNRVTGAVCGTVRLLPGSDVELTCGSITVRNTGSVAAEVVLSDDTSALVAPGATATLQLTAGGVTVTAGSVVLTGQGGGATLTAGSGPVALWDFVGFDQPVDNGGVFNRVNAGRTIPLKWRVLTESGAPVTTLSGATVRLAGITCAAGAPVDDIEETVASPGALVNLGNGNYRLNWQTARTLAGCQQLRLSLAGEGPVVHTALFRFS